jgi:hypothetical protein
MATAFSVGVPHHGDYVFLAAAHPHPDLWQNVGFDLRAREWWELEGFASAELSDTYPVLALAYADADTPTTSSHARLFDRLTLRSNLTGALLQASESVPDDPLTADGVDGTSRAWFNLASYDEDRVDQACLGTGNIRAESGLWLAHFWNMDELRFLHPSYADAGTAIGIEVLGGGCLADGSSIALYAATADGTQYGRVGDDGFVNYVSTDVGDAETFTVTFDPTPAEDWTDELVYAP